jgi:hypothetical protein
MTIVLDIVMVAVFVVGLILGLTVLALIVRDRNL